MPYKCHDHNLHISKIIKSTKIEQRGRHRKRTGCVCLDHDTSPEMSANNKEKEGQDKHKIQTSKREQTLAPNAAKKKKDEENAKDAAMIISNQRKCRKIRKSHFQIS